jgi:hypothetical protein
MPQFLPKSHCASCPHPVIEKEHVPSQFFSVTEQGCYPLSFGWKIMDQLISEVERIRSQQVVMMGVFIAVNPSKQSTTGIILAKKMVHPVDKAPCAKLVQPLNGGVKDESPTTEGRKIPPCLWFTLKNSDL